DTLSCFSVVAEYRGVANAVAEKSWIHNLLRELHSPLFTATLVYYDNDTLSRFSAEAEYRGVANAVAEKSWIHNLLRELHAPLFTATLVYYDNGNSYYTLAL
nr:ribonuclease H-like domain-containing protein [Tanacetum cinerariifolium]